MTNSNTLPEGDASGRAEDSSPGRWDQLDHVRAIAAFMVFTWHFTHGADGRPSPFAGAPFFPLAALFDEGHVGVSVFMCLSGYLFAKLLDGKAISYSRFIAARLVRLGPLLLSVMALETARHVASGGKAADYLEFLLRGFVVPAWPNGGWSITVELHFYAILPILLSLRRRMPSALLLMLALAIGARALLHAQHGSVQFLAYWTIVGRLDQFLLGIACYDNRHALRSRHALAAAVATTISVVYYLFDSLGGFYHLGTYPSASPLWIVLPTLEAACFSALIAWYDTSFAFRGRAARLLARIGFYSYGIYLLHFYFFGAMAHFVDSRLVPLGNFYVAWAFAVPCFALMTGPAWVAFHLIEKPFQRLRPSYVIHAASDSSPVDSRRAC